MKKTLILIFIGVVLIVFSVIFFEIDSTNMFDNETFISAAVLIIPVAYAFFVLVQTAISTVYASSSIYQKKQEKIGILCIVSCFIFLLLCIFLTVHDLLHKTETNTTEVIFDSFAQGLWMLAGLSLLYTFILKENFRRKNKRPSKLI